MASAAIDGIRFGDVRGKHLLIALSGGADSVALAYLLAENQQEYDLRISAAHFHHGIRADAADADAAFCRELCHSLGFDFIEGRADLPRIAAERKIGLETVAREERYRFLREAKNKCNADFIALAHHLDDQAETILMHLFRGAGPEGISGMARKSGDLYRPLLNIRKKDLMQFLTSRHICWREDSTNGVCDNPRNALRLNVLPEIEKSYPSAAEAIARHGFIARMESDYLARLTDDFMEKNVQAGSYGIRISMVPPPEEVFLRRAIRRICGSGLSMLKLDEAIQLCAKKRGRLEISGKLAAEKTPTWLYFLPKPAKKPEPRPIAIPGETILDGICRVTVEEGGFEIDRRDPRTQVLDADTLEGAVLRTRMEGDRLRPLGAPGNRLLSDFLTDKKIDRPLRECLPLIAVGNRVLWIGGLGIAENAKIHNATMRRVRITWEQITTDERPEVQQ